MHDDYRYNDKDEVNNKLPYDMLTFRKITDYWYQRQTLPALIAYGTQYVALSITCVSYRIQPFDASYLFKALNGQVSCDRQPTQHSPLRAEAKFRSTQAPCSTAVQQCVYTPCPTLTQQEVRLPRQRGG